MMNTEIKQQIIRQMKMAKNVLIAFKNIKCGRGYPAGGDAVSSALALYQILNKNNKEAAIVSPNFSLSKTLSGLPEVNQIKSSFQSAKHAKISIPIEQSGLKNFSYEKNENRLNIYLVPCQNFIDLKNLEINNKLWQYDLIIILDTPSLFGLEDIYLQNKNFFDDLPIINIDHHPQNEYFGHINLVDIKSSSVAEIIWQLLCDSKNIDEKIVECLLAGIIAKTKNFKKSGLGAGTLQTVSQLTGLGANKEKILENFYKNKAVETLKLWGRALARLKYKNNIVWSLLARTDFIHCGAEEESLPDVIHELMANSSDAKIAALLFESKENKIKLFLYSETRNIEIPALKISYAPNQIGDFVLSSPHLVAAEKELIENLEKII